MKWLPPDTRKLAKVRLRPDRCPKAGARRSTQADVRQHLRVDVNNNDGGRGRILIRT